MLIGRFHLLYDWASLVAQLVKNPPAMQETQVQSLGGEDPLEKEMATHSSIPAWKISWIEEPGGLQSMGSQRVRHNWVTNTYLLLGVVEFKTYILQIIFSHSELFFFWYWLRYFCLLESWYMTEEALQISTKRMNYSINGAEIFAYTNGKLK